MKNLKWLFGIFFVVVVVWVNNVNADAALIDNNGFEYVENNDGTVSIIGYYGTEETVTIPSEIDEKIVNSVRYFSQNNKVKNVIISQGIQYIGYDVIIEEGESGFAYCKNLESIDIPNTVTTIGAYSFEGCSKLYDINLPENVLEIEPYTFLGCISLKNISIPDSVEKIGIDAFNNCSNLNEIVLPEKLTHIYNRAFYNTGISEINIPRNVNLISPNAFSGCNKLLNITVDIENTDYTSLNGVLCNKLGTDLVSYPSGRDYFEIAQNINELGMCSVVGCDNLISVTIPQNIKIIGESNFSKCCNLQNVKIEEGCIKIAESSFSNCPSLKKIIIPDSVSTIKQFENNAIIYTNPDSYARKYADEHGMKFSCINHNNIVTDNAIPATCTEDGRTAGSHCADCGTIISGCEKIPGKHKIIIIDKKATCTEDSEHYTYCEICGERDIDENGHGLASFGRIAATGHKFDGIITKKPSYTNEGIKTYTCKVCGETKTISISKLKTPIIGKKLKYAESSYKVTKSGVKNGTVEFNSLKNLKSSIIIPDTVTIDNITYKVTSIAKNAFKNNKKVKKITIGNNIMNINANAFNGCKNLKTITIKSKKIKTVGKNALKGIHKNAKVKVPKSQLKKYRKLFKNKGQKSTVKITK